MKLLLVLLLGCISESRSTQSLMGGFSLRTNKMQIPPQKELKFTLVQIGDDFLGQIYTRDSFFMEAMKSIKFTLFAFIKGDQECLLFFDKTFETNSLNDGALGFQFSLEEFKNSQGLDLSIKNDSFKCISMMKTISTIDDFYFVPLSHGQYKENTGLSAVRSDLNNIVNKKLMKQIDGVLSIKQLMNEFITQQISVQLQYRGYNYKGDIVTIKKTMK